MQKFKFFKILSKPVSLTFTNNLLLINGFLVNSQLKLKNKSLFELTENKLIIKKHI